VIEIAPTPVGQIIVPPGESGFIPFPIPASPPPHLRDQLPLYESFSYRPMPFAPGDLEGLTTTETLPLACPPRASSFLRRGAVGYGDERGSRPGVRKGGFVTGDFRVVSQVLVRAQKRVELDFRTES